MNAKENTTLATLLADRNALRAYVELGDKVAEAAAEHVQRIKEKVAVATDAKNAADHGKTAKDGIWAETLAVVGIVADLTKDSPKLREQVYSDVMGGFMAKDSDGKASTAAAYASTGRNVLVKLVTDRGMSVAAVKEKSYADVRKLLRPTANAEAEGIADKIAKAARYVAKNGNKHGGEAAAKRLEAVWTALEPHYNAVKAAKDAKTNAAKAAKELEANRQQRPAEPMQTETVKAEAPANPAKPEAPKLAANG